MKHFNPCYLKLILAFLFLNAALFVDAQKLPKVQAASVLAPADIKIDGRIQEWHDQLQASNPTCRLSYTLSNDDRNLYLTVRMAERRGNAKVLQAGITFTVKQPAEGGEKPNDLLIAFPVPLNKYSTDRENIKASAASYFMMRLDEETPGNKKADSLIAIANQELTDAFKEIKIDGIPGITEPLISIYNNEGIRAASRFDEKMRYVYELAVPLKYFTSAVVSGKKFRYNIKLASAAITTSSNPNTPAPPVVVRDAGAPVDFNYEYMNAPADFWGDYTLTK